MTSGHDERTRDTGPSSLNTVLGIVVPVALLELTMQTLGALHITWPEALPLVPFALPELVGFGLMVRGCGLRIGALIAIGYFPLMTCVLVAYPFITRNIWAAVTGTMR